MPKALLLVVLTLIVCSPLVSAQTRRPARRDADASAQRSKPAAATKSRPAPAVAPAKSEDDCACDAGATPDVAAVVNGVKITAKEIDEPVQSQIDELLKQVADARAGELDLQINSLLLEAEAKKRGVSTAKLLETEVSAKTPAPTAAEALAFYNENKSRLQGEFKTLEADILAYLREQKQSQRAKQLAEQLRAAAKVEVLVPKATPPANEAERARVFARVNGAAVTSGMIEDALRPLVFDVSNRIYELRKARLDLRVNDLLLEQEARRRQVTTKAILDAEVGAGQTAVTEEEARAFYEQNRARINGAYEQIRPQLIQYLQEQRSRTAQERYAEQLRKGAQLQVYLKPPVPPVFEIATDDQPQRGNPAAAVTLVEFTDYQCLSCARQQPVLNRLLAEYGPQIRLVVRDYPLPRHEHAFKAAEAAEAARAQGKYWEFVDILYNNQQALGVEKLKEYASFLGLDRAKFDAMLDSGRMAEKVRRDMQDGNKFGVNGTPTIYVNGRRQLDPTYEGLRAAIDEALRQKAKG